MSELNRKSLPSVRDHFPPEFFEVNNPLYFNADRIGGVPIAEAYLAQVESPDISMDGALELVSMPKNWLTLSYHCGLTTSRSRVWLLWALVQNVSWELLVLENPDLGQLVVSEYIACVSDRTNILGREVFWMLVREEYGGHAIVEQALAATMQTLGVMAGSVRVHDGCERFSTVDKFLTEIHLDVPNVLSYLFSPKGTP